MTPPRPSLSTRRTVVSAFASGALAVPALAVDSSPAPQDPSLVRDWVIKAHARKLEPMLELLKSNPELIHASLDWGGGDWETALQAAAHTGSQAMARFLIEHGARLDLFAACMLGELQFVTVALATFPRSLEVRGAHGIALLSHAIAGGEPASAVVALLLEKGADVNAVHNNGTTALTMAVQSGRTELVQMLIAKGANVSVRTKAGATPLSLSLKGGNAGIVAALRAAGARD